MRYPLALSTCWNSHRHTDGYAMLKEIHDLGFSAVELSHGIRIGLIPGILKAVSEKWIRVTSLHNFCPLPPMVNFAAPNYYMPTSPYRGERRSWVNQTIKTLYFCRDTGADLVVMHMGRVAFLFGSPWLRYEKLQDQAKTEARREKAAIRLAKAQKKVLSRLSECLDQVVPIAKEMGIRLVAENREDPHEVPVDYEGEKFWIEYAQSYGIGYWHDTGHAQVKQLDGLLNVQSWLENLHPHLQGWHLHDVNTEGKDHQVPGTGCIDFKSVLSFYKPEHALTLELSPSLSSEQVLQSVDYLRQFLPSIR
jgi:sugar phosphate isomerase/epimerase